MDAHVSAVRHGAPRCSPRTPAAARARSSAPSSARGLTMRSFARVACSSRRMPDEDGAITLAREQRAQPFRLARGGARLRRQRSDRVASSGGHVLDSQVEVPLARDAVAERVDLGQLHAGVELHDRHRNRAEQRLAHQPQQRGAVLAHRPQHAGRREQAVRVANDRDGARLERAEILFRRVHRQTVRRGLRNSLLTSVAVAIAVGAEKIKRPTSEKARRCMVPRPRVELGTPGFSDLCSTN